MGKESYVDIGWLPNYYQHDTTIYINWSKEAVNNMKNEPHSDLANWEFRCKKGLVFSKAGIYAPTFRLSTGSIIDSGCNGIFSDNISIVYLLGILCSKLIRYQFNTYINHTVNAQVDDIKEISICLNSIAEKQIINFVRSIIENQKQNPLYDYASNEQNEIDCLVYEAYGLNAEDIHEIEYWYARRYPKLAMANQKNQMC